MLSRALLCVALALVAPRVEAATTKIAVVNISADRSTVYVVFAAPRPDPSTLTTRSSWDVTAFPPSGAPQRIDVTDVVINSRRYPSTGTVALKLAKPVTADTPIQVGIRIGTIAVAQTTQGPPEPKALLEPVDNEDDADLYFKGVISPGHTLSIDNVDVKAALVWYLPAVDIGPTVTYKHDSSDDKDPDVFASKFTIKGYGQGYRPSWALDAPVIDADAQGKTVNVGVGATAILSHHYDRRTPDPKTRAVLLRSSFEPEFSLSIETGTNVKNGYRATLGESGGSGGYFRVVPRFAGYLTVPTGGPIRKVLISAEYVTRLLAREELFLETRDLAKGEDPRPMFDKTHRDHVKMAAKFMATEWFGVEAAYEHGSLPPAFKFVQHKGSIGLVFMAAQGKP